MLSRREFVQISSLTSAAMVIGLGTLTEEAEARIQDELAKDRFGTTNPLWDSGQAKWGCSQFKPDYRQLLRT